MPAARKGMTYAEAGVDIDAGEEVVQRIRRWVKGTYTPQVVTDSHGAFGGYFRIAAESYERAVREILSRDKDWLASLMMKLDSLLEDLKDPDGKAGAQVDQFLERVSQGLTQMRLTIQANQSP